MIKILIVLLLLISTAAAEKGIVVNSANIVQYKFDLPLLNGSSNIPKMNAGEYYVLRNDINQIEKTALYYPLNGSYKNPVKELQPEIVSGIKNRYVSHINNLTVISQTGTANEKAFAYVLLDILKFMKFVFWS